MTTVELRSPVRVKMLQGASKNLDVIPVQPEQGRYMVGSASQTGAYYHVQLSGFGGTCSCQWGQHGGANCKHVLAALRTHYAGAGQLSFWPTLGAARRQHRQLLGGGQIYGTLRRKR